jgi:hypothetical protein
VRLDAAFSAYKRVRLLDSLGMMYADPAQNIIGLPIEFEGPAGLVRCVFWVVDNWILYYLREPKYVE